VQEREPGREPGRERELVLAACPLAA